jgi:tetratricopeptide (TPR) repeat protein
MVWNIMDAIPSVVRRSGIRVYQCVLVCALCAGLFSTSHSQTPDVQAKFRLAQGFDQAGEWERAAELYNDLLRGEPGNFVYFDGLQRMYVQLKRYDDAIALIRKRLVAQSNDLTLYGTLGTVEYRAGREPEAMSAWEHAIALAPANQQSYRLVASLMIESRLLDKAADVYRQGRAACHDPQLFAIELAQLLVASMDYTGATREYLRWLEQNPAQISFVQNRMATFTYKEDGRAAAIRVVQDQPGVQTNLRLNELLGWLHMEGKDFDRAFDVYKQIDKLSGANGVALLGFADRTIRERAFVVAIRAYQAALQCTLPPPRVPQAKYGYACALVALQISADSGNALAQPGGRPVSEPRTRFADALAAFTKIVEDFPQSEYSAKSLYQLGMIQLRQFQDLNSAARTFQQILAEPVAGASLRNDVQLRMGEMLVARADTAGAAAAFRSLLSTMGATPDQTDEAQLHLAELAFYNGHTDDALQMLSAISANVQNDFANDALELQVLLRENAGAPPEALALYGRAEFLSRQHRNTEAVQILSDLVRQFPGSPLVDDALLRIGGLNTQAGLYREAVAAYTRLLDQFHDQSKMLDRALFRMAEVYHYGLGDRGQAVATYERLLAEQPLSILAGEARKRIRVLRGETL